MTSLCVLISSAGRRVELLECFRRAAKSLQISMKLIACDVDPTLSAACRISDQAFKVPRCEDPSFIDTICQLTTENGVDLIIPTIDPELEPLSLAAERLYALGARVHVSPVEVIEIVRDKLKTARLLAEAGVPVPLTAKLSEVRADPGSWIWPVFLKPRGGSASRGLSVVQKPEDLPPSVNEPMIVQELLQGPEYTVNMFIDAGGALRAVVPHKRIRIRAGEVEKGRTERHHALAELAQKIASVFPTARGAICFQVILDPIIGPKVLEINARFGGGYPLTDHAGGRFAQWLLEEVAALPSSIDDKWRENVVMLRYDAAVFFEGRSVKGDGVA